MANSFLNLTAEKHDYIIQTRAETAYEIELRRVGKIATRITAAIRAYREETISLPKRETCNDKGPAPAQEIPSSRAAQTRGPLEYAWYVLGELEKWYKQQQFVAQTNWSNRWLQELKDSILEAGQIALELRILGEEQEESLSLIHI